MAVSLSPSSSIPSQHIARETIEIGSSSPRLPSPTSFLKKRQLALKSGTNVSQVPEGAAVGFIKASRIRLEEEQAARLSSADDTEMTVVAAGGAEADRVVAPPHAVSGRLVKPNKRSERTSVLVEQHDKRSSKKTESANEVTVIQTSRAAEADRAVEKDMVQLAPEALPSEAIQHESAPTVKAKKSRKRTSNNGQTAEGATKPRKKTAKAEEASKAAGKNGNLDATLPSQAEVIVPVEQMEVKVKKPRAPRRKRKSDEIAGEDCPKKQNKPVKKPRRTSDDSVIIVEKGRQEYPGVRSASFEAEIAAADVAEAPRPSITKDEMEVTGLDIAPRRRRSWTPVNDSNLPPSHHYFRTTRRCSPAARSWTMCLLIPKLEDGAS